jgi:2-polyprenyl-3-methyl-5-hydroxy-6-metoxy-1,4-benzoquinol methylase
MSNHLIKEIAWSLDASPNLLPYLPDLLADLGPLGSKVDRIIQIVSSLGLDSTSTKVIDLGCGKGYLALALAEKFKFNVLGIDGFKPFLEEAEIQAEQQLLNQYCKFEFADLRTYIDYDLKFNLVLYTAMGDLLGNLSKTVSKLRKLVSSDGYLLIDDGFLADPSTSGNRSLKNYFSHEKALTQLTAFGDKIITEVIIPKEEIHQYNMQTTELIRKRAQILASYYPHLSDSFYTYVLNQIEECKIIENKLISAIWLLQKKE